jgi:hypothetical protein
MLVVTYVMAGAPIRLAMPKDRALALPWTFERLGRLESLKIRYPPPDDARSEPDPAPFAHALAVAISARAGDP